MDLKEVGGGGKRSEERTNFSQDAMYEKINTFNFFLKREKPQKTLIMPIL